MINSHLLYQLSYRGTSEGCELYRVAGKGSTTRPMKACCEYLTGSQGHTALGKVVDVIQLVNQGVKCHQEFPSG